MAALFIDLSRLTRGSLLSGSAGGTHNSIHAGTYMRTDGEHPLQVRTGGSAVAVTRSAALTCTHTAVRLGRCLLSRPGRPWRAAAWTCDLQHSSLLLMVTV